MAFGDDILSGMTEAPTVAPAINTLATAPVAQPAPAAPAYKEPSGLSNFLGRLGDALLVANGHQPMYEPRVEARRQRAMQAALGQQIANYLGDADSGLAAVFQADPQAGMSLYKMRHPDAGVEPEIVRELRAAGIDPASDQGKQILVQHLGGSGQGDTTFVRTLQALGIDPHSPQALELYYASVSPAGFLLKPPAGGAPAAPQSLPKVGSPDEARALPPGSKFIMPDGRVGTVPGGATASTPSPTFR